MNITKSELIVLFGKYGARNLNIFLLYYQAQSEYEGEKVNMSKNYIFFSKIKTIFFQVKLQNNISYQMADIHHLKGKRLTYKLRSLNV